MLCFSFPFYANAKANVTYGMHYYTTTEPDHAKHDSLLAAYRGRFYSQNIRIIGFSSKAVAFPYKPL